MATAPVIQLTAQVISKAIITAAMRVHTELGPGSLESACSACLRHELKSEGYDSSPQVGLPVVYRGVKLDIGYLKLSGKSIGLLINFNVVHLKDGIKHFVNGTHWQ